MDQDRGKKGTTLHLLFEQRRGSSCRALGEDEDAVVDGRKLALVGSERLPSSDRLKLTDADERVEHPSTELLTEAHRERRDPRRRRDPLGTLQDPA